MKLILIQIFLKAFGEQRHVWPFYKEFLTFRHQEFHSQWNFRYSNNCCFSFSFLRHLFFWGRSFLKCFSETSALPLTCQLVMSKWQMCGFVGADICRLKNTRLWRQLSFSFIWLVGKWPRLPADSLNDSFQSKITWGVYDIREDIFSLEASYSEQIY